MHPDEPASRPDESLERRLLRGVQHVARRRQENHHLVSFQRIVAENGCVFARLHSEAALPSLLLNGRSAGRNRIVPEAFSF